MAAQRVARVAVVGTTSWGTTLAILMARQGLTVTLLARSAEEAAALAARRENVRLLPGFPFPVGLCVTADGSAALADADLVVLAVPSETMRQNVRGLAGLLGPQALVLSAAKGLEVETGKRMSEVVAEELLSYDPERIGVLSGPNLSREIVAGRPAASVVAAREVKAAERMREALQAPAFRIYTQRDVVGVELGGALKNVIALGAGMIDGLAMGSNAKAVLITRGLMEVTRLGVAMGAHPLTFSGLTGLGDLMATCFSPLSRNRFVGQELVKGRLLDEIVGAMGDQVVEGIPTTRAACQVAQRLGVEMPIVEQLYRILFEGLDSRQAALELMQREPKNEVVGFDELSQRRLSPDDVARDR